MAPALVAGLWVAAMAAWNGPGSGEDLASGYVAAALWSAGEQREIYAHDPAYFHKVGSERWVEVARARRYDGKLHPYVQAPLWAWMVRPVAAAMDFPAARASWLLVHLTTLAALFALVAARWAPGLLAPAPFAAGLLLLGASEPARYGLLLGQTHAVFVLGALVAFVLAERGRSPRLAGALLAFVALIKITPGVLALWWLMRRRWAALGAFALAGAGWLGLTWAVAGGALFSQWAATLGRASGTALVAYNNQSVIAWVERFGHEYMASLNWRPVPIADGHGGLVALVAVAALAALVIRLELGARRGADVGGYAAAGLLLWSTVFAPIAWSHYFIVAVVPCVVLWPALRRRRADRGGLVALGAAVLLNLRPFAIDQADVTGSLDGNMLQWSHLASAALLFALLLVVRQNDEAPA